MTHHKKWDPWLEALRPDEVTRLRMRRHVLREARSILAARGDNWLDAVADWATILSPVAAAVTLVFAGLALKQAAQPAGVPELEAQAPAVEELVAPGEGLPAAFSGDSIPDLNVVMTVLYEPAELP
jgi:hypothetical protein